MSFEQHSQFTDEVAKITDGSRLSAVAVSLHDLETGARVQIQGDRRFHAASTIKVAILLALFRAVDEGKIRLDDPLHVRNRFHSAADGSPFQVDADSDGFPQLYRSIGRTARIGTLAETMITSSSNLATNLLLEFLGVPYARSVLAEANIDGVELRRGVEDEEAHERRLNNETTADGLVSLFGVLRGDYLSKPSRDEAINILLHQKFNSMIPAGLPQHASVAHKTGEISTVCHDAGIVYLPEREPYILAILTEFPADVSGARDVVAQISKVAYRFLTPSETAAA
jgi:beta-lactamase class A